jgi:chaperonin cofactor prefoldin
MTDYRVTGRWETPNGWQSFETELEAENERLREHAATLEDRLDTVESRLDVAQDELPTQGVADD